IAVLSFKVKSYNEYFLLGRKISHKKHPVNVSLVSNIYGAVQFEKSSLPAVFSWKIVRSLISEIHSLSVLDHCYSLSLQNRWLPLQALAFRCGVSLGRALPAGVPHTHSNQLCFILDGTSFVSIEASCIFKTSKELDFIKQ
ncbi:hypothetical protein M0L17_26780, partial [Bacillaceae bacterium OS4b]|nr:hypothetical protein [Bacillaceae bacterium OS4b]